MQSGRRLCLFVVEEVDLLGECRAVDDGVELQLCAFGEQLKCSLGEVLAVLLGLKVVGGRLVVISDELALALVELDDTQIKFCLHKQNVYRVAGPKVPARSGRSAIPHRILFCYEVRDRRLATATCRSNALISLCDSFVFLPSITHDSELSTRGCLDRAAASGGSIYCPSRFCILFAFPHSHNKKFCKKFIFRPRLRSKCLTQCL